MDEIDNKAMNKDAQGNDFIANISGSYFDKAKNLLKILTNDERMELLEDYCKYCGDADPRCQCWNDE